MESVSRFGATAWGLMDDVADVLRAALEPHVPSEWITTQTTLGVLLGVISLAIFAAGYAQQLRSAQKEESEEKPNTVYLHVFPRVPHAPSVSSFCLKLESFLRAANIPHVVRPSVNMGPNGKMPWIRVNGEVVPDSELCIDLLTRVFNVQLDNHLTPEQAAQGLAIRRMLEEHTYFAVVYFRWLEEPDTVAKNSFPFPWPIGQVLVRLISRFSIKPALVGQGIGRHSRDTILKKALADLHAVSTILGTKKFFHGEQLSTTDVAVFGLTGVVIFSAFNDPVKKAIMSDPELGNLHTHALRVRELIWPDWDACCTTSRKLMA